MNEIINVLNISKKLTASEIANNIKELPEKIIGELLVLEREGEVEQLNGYWSIKLKKTKKRRDFTGVDICDILDKWGALTLRDISYLTDIDAPEVKSDINNLIEARSIIRGVDGKYRALKPPAFQGMPQIKKNNICCD